MMNLCCFLSDVNVSQSDADEGRDIERFGAPGKVTQETRDRREKWSVAAQLQLRVYREPSLVTSSETKLLH